MLKIGRSTGFFDQIREIRNLLGHLQKDFIVNSDGILAQRLRWHREVMLKVGSHFPVLHDSRLAWTSPKLQEG